MGLLSELRLAVGMAAVVCLAALIYLVMRTRSLGRKQLFARPAGSAARGVWYIFTTGMSPAHKESAGRHMPTFLTGIIYHLGLFGALAFLIMSVVSAELVAATVTVGRFVFLAGLLAGLALLIKRLAVGYMRKISVADDFISNLLVDLFLAGALVITFRPDWLAFWYGTAALLFLYIPLGKIRHCVFFFYARGEIGALFGRRGVFGGTLQEGGAHE